MTGYSWLIRSVLECNSLDIESVNRDLKYSVSKVLAYCLDFIFSGLSANSINSCYVIGSKGRYKFMDDTAGFHLKVLAHFRYDTVSLVAMTH